MKPSSPSPGCSQGYPLDRGKARGSGHRRGSSGWSRRAAWKLVSSPLCAPLTRALAWHLEVTGQAQLPCSAPHSSLVYSKHPWDPCASASDNSLVMSDSCDPMGCSPPGSSAHGIVQARTLEWFAISSSTGSSQHRG